MSNRILIALFAAVALSPAAALANPGHVADMGQGHTHWQVFVLYVLLGCAALGLAFWARALFMARSQTKEQR